MQTQLSFETTHARKRDPQTSKDAATKAEKFYKTHAGIIYRTLLQYGPQTPYEIALRCGLNYYQVSRRMSDLLDMGLAKPNGEKRTSPGGEPSQVWGVKVG